MDNPTETPDPGSAAPKNAGPSLLACLHCRQKHLKCDGKTPVCGRCQSSGSPCQYTPSRRGYKGPSKKRARPDSISEPVAGDWTLDNPLSLPPVGEWFGGGGGGGGGQDWGTQNSGVDNNAPMSIPGQDVFLPSILGSIASEATAGHGPLTPDSSQSAAAGDGYLIEIYYNYFHPAHPVLRPLRYLDAARLPPFLDQVIKFIGSHYTPAASSETYRSTVVSSTLAHSDTVEKVQALLLLAIVLHSRNERTEAGECLTIAVDTAFALGLDGADYATTMSNGDPVREESLRRTWWELFVVEGMLTALGVQPVFRTNTELLQHRPFQVALPSEERIYQDGLRPPSPAPRIAQFDARVFADDDDDDNNISNSTNHNHHYHHHSSTTTTTTTSSSQCYFSSFTYRLEAIRILGRVVAIQGIDDSSQQDHVEAIDARIASWFHHLPESKAELMRPDGSIDEMMFQATMIINGAAIYLHFPRSDLLSSPAVAAEVICGHHGPLSIPAFSHHAHAMKALKAASEVSSLAALRHVPVTKHTPFFICAMVLSSIVQLAACSVKAGHMPDPSRDRLALTIGVFKSLARIWAISQLIMRQIKAVARDVMDMGLRPTVDHLDLNTVLEGGRSWVPGAGVDLHR